MATIEVTLRGAATTAARVAIPDEARFLAWVSATYPADTLAERLELWWQATMAGTAANVASFERTAAAATAVAEVKELLTPPVWRAGIAVTVGQRFFHEGRVYLVRQAHRTQSDWTPDRVAALWTAE